MDYTVLSLNHSVAQIMEMEVSQKIQVLVVARFLRNEKCSLNTWGIVVGTRKGTGHERQIHTFNVCHGPTFGDTEASAIEISLHSRKEIITNSSGKYLETIEKA